MECGGCIIYSAELKRHARLVDAILTSQQRWGGGEKEREKRGGGERERGRVLVELKNLFKNMSCSLLHFFALFLNNLDSVYPSFPPSSFSPFSLLLSLHLSLSISQLVFSQWNFDRLGPDWRERSFTSFLLRFWKESSQHRRSGLDKCCLRNRNLACLGATSQM